MAKVELNRALKSVRGQIDGFRYTKRGQQTIITPAHEPRKKRKISEAELQTQVRLRRANCWSHEAKNTHPELWSRYVAVSKQRGSVPFAVSNRDYNHPPVVEAIDATAYRGSPRQVIRIRAHDDFEVRDVTIAIRSGETAIETGFAVRQPDGTWHYTATATVTGTVTIEAIARDWPDNKATKSIHVDLTSPPAIDDSPRARLVQKIRRAAQRQGHYVLPNGRTRMNHFDKYRLAHSPALLREIAEQLVPLVPPDTEILAGLELGGVPVATLLSQLTGKTLVLLRKEPREWGTTLPAEGGDLAGRRILVIADVVTTGQQLATAARRLRHAGGIVTHALCILDEQSGAPALVGKQAIALTSLFTTFELIA